MKKTPVFIGLLALLPIILITLAPAGVALKSAPDVCEKENHHAPACATQVVERVLFVGDWVDEYVLNWLRAYIDGEISFDMTQLLIEHHATQSRPHDPSIRKYMNIYRTRDYDSRIIWHTPLTLPK